MLSVKLLLTLGLLCLVQRTFDCVQRTPRDTQWPKLHPALESAAAPPNPFVPVAAGDVDLGKPADSDTYGWDNEYGRRCMHVPAFEASKYQISNGDFLEFVRAGGYQRESFWTADGWRWCAP